MKKIIVAVLFAGLLATTGIGCGGSGKETKGNTKADAGATKVTGETKDKGK